MNNWLQERCRHRAMACYTRRRSRGKDGPSSENFKHTKSYPREGDIPKAGEENISLSYHPKVHYRIHKRMLLVRIMNQINPVAHKQMTSLEYALMLVSQLCLDLPTGHFLSGFPTKFWMMVSSQWRQ